MLAYNVTTAWFMDESVTSNGTNINVIGTIDLDVTTNFNFYNLALAPDTTYTTDKDGQDIGTYMKTSSKTSPNLHVYVRIRYTATRWDKLQNKTIPCSELTLYFQSSKFTNSTTYNSATDAGKWVYDPTSNYYYYLGKIGTGEIQFNAGYTTNNALHNDIADAEVDIQFDIEVIQQPYGAYDAVWTDAPAIFDAFAKADSGYPKTT